MYCLGFVFNPRGRSHWTADHNVITGAYETKLPGGSFRSIAKSYRLQGCEANDRVREWNDAYNHQWSFDRISLNIYHLRLPVGLKELIWRLSIGKVFTGPDCTKYLSHFNLLSPLIINLRDKCLFHHQDDADDKHVLWSCSKVTAVWDLVNTYLGSMGYDFQINQLGDALDALNSYDHKHIRSVVLFECILYAIHAIWLINQHAINLKVNLLQAISDVQVPVADRTRLADKCVQFIPNYTQNIVDLYNHLITKAIHSLPHSNDHCHECDMSDLLGQPSSRLSVRQRMIAPPIKIKFDSLTQEQVELYNYTWCSGDKQLAEIAPNRILIVKVSGRDARGLS